LNASNSGNNFQFHHTKEGVIWSPKFVRTSHSGGCGGEDLSLLEKGQACIGGHMLRFMLADEQEEEKE
jgi:hypothetical protein